MCIYWARAQHQVQMPHFAPHLPPDRMLYKQVLSAGACAATACMLHGELL